MDCEKKEEGERAKSMAEQKTEKEIEPEPQNVTKPAMDRDQIEQSREQGQQVMAGKSLAQNDDNKHQPLQFPSFDDLRPEDRVKAPEVWASINKALVGKYFLCKTIGPAMDMGALVVSVSDPLGDVDAEENEAVGGQRLILYNYSSIPHSEFQVSFDEILPLGSFLVLKNPLLTDSFNWHCDNPAEVELVSRKRVEAKFPDLEWSISTATTGAILFQKKHFWSRIEGDEAAFAQLKRFGNVGFVEKRFSDAIRFYNMALDYCGENRGDEAMIQSNKCAALLALGCFNSALKCAEVALEIDPGNEKYSYRKTKALIGLEKYEEGLSFLGAQFDQFPSLNKSKDCKTLLENVKFLCSRKNLGPTESQLISLHMKNLEDDDKIPEFTGPLALAQTEGKGRGRGLIATQDIHPGQLLICAKAFCLEATPPISTIDTVSLMMAKMNQLTSGIGDNTVFDKPTKPYIEEAVKSIANKLLFEPELGAEFYSLSAGDDLGHFEPGDLRTGHVDLKRINEILRINAFGSDRSERDSPVEFTGLWILPSYFNHSCSEYNCSWSICGEWMMVKAIAEIKKGEELTLAYKSPIFSYGERHHYFTSLGFSCSCKLCQMEAKEPESVKKERQEILKFVGEITSKSSNKKIKMALKEVEKLASLRKDNVALNFPLLSPQIVRLANTLFGKGRFDDCISVLNQMFPVANDSVRWHDDGIYMALNLLGCHAVKKEGELSKEWIVTVKRLMMKFHGSLELMRIKEWATLELLQTQLGMDFFQED